MAFAVVAFSGIVDAHDIYYPNTQRYSYITRMTNSILWIAAAVTMGAGAVYGLFLLSLLFSFLSGTPYIGIPRKSLYEILAFGELTGDDIFYDLGSGDGRVLITAREHFGVARAVGFEIAPWPYFVSRARVALKRFAGHISIHCKSFLKADLSPASFVYVYLYRELLNEKVAPKLVRELRRGAKILSCSSSIDITLHPQFHLLKTGKIGSITVFLYEKI